MHAEHIVTRGTQRAQTGRHGVGIDQQIGNHDHDAGTPNQMRRLLQRQIEARVTSGALLQHRGDEPLKMRRSCARRYDGAHRVVEPHEAHGITLLEEQQRQCRRQLFGVCLLGELRAGTLPLHRATDIEQQHGAKIRLFLELFHDPAFGARRDFPVDVAQIVARLIRTVLGEFHAEALARRAMQAGEKAVDQPARTDFEPAKCSEHSGINEIGTGLRSEGHLVERGV